MRAGVHAVSWLLLCLPCWQPAAMMQRCCLLFCWSLPAPAAMDVDAAAAVELLLWSCNCLLESALLSADLSISSLLRCVRVPDGAKGETAERRA